MAKGDREHKAGRPDAPPPMRPAKPARVTAPPDDDHALWHHVTRSIKPLRPPRAKSRAKPQAKPIAPPEAAVSATEKARATAPSTPAAAPPRKPALRELTPGVVHDVDKRTAQRLGRGQLAIDGRLDLHGLTQTEAHARLAGFIRRSVAAGHRCVLVITGKGYKPSGETGVLRQAVPRWLNEAALRPHIVALRHAQPKDGGEGALYVLLRRERGGPPSGDKDAPPPKRLRRVKP